MNVRERPKRFVWVAAMPFVTPALYFVGIGPAAWLTSSECLDERATKVVKAIYAPVSRRAERTGDGANVLSWYVSLWTR